jgi:hypothetical protein
VPGLLRGSAGGVTLTTFSQNSVDVAIGLENDPAAGTRLTGRFTPTQPEFHLYSKDLPRDGLEGIGRPTLLEIVSTETMEISGPVTVDQEEEINYVEVLDLGFPVYPAGPVTIHIPVKIAPGSGGKEAELSITYMTCKGGACLPPVIDKRITVTLPANLSTE